MQDIASTVTHSSPNGHNIPHIVTEETEFADWSEFTSRNVKPIKNIKSFQHFRISEKNPGKVFVKVGVDDSKIEINVLKWNADVIEKYPRIIKTEGLDEYRQWYLFEEIAPLCNESKHACPEPNLPKPKKRKIYKKNE